MAHTTNLYHCPFFQDSNFVRFVLLIFSSLVFTRDHALPGSAATKLHLLFRNLLCGQTRQACASCSSTDNNLFIPPFQRPIHPHPPSDCQGSPPKSLRCDNRFPPSRPFKHRACRPHEARKTIVFRECDFGRGQKCCWVFSSVTKNFRAGWRLKALTPFCHFPLPFERSCYNLRPDEPESTTFSTMPGIGWFIRICTPDPLVTPI